MVDRKQQQQSQGALPAVAAEVEGGRASAARRRFVKGTALAMPAILTLRSGAAWALQSLSCMQKRMGDPLNPGVAFVLGPADPDDNFVRDQTAGLVSPMEPTVVEFYADTVSGLYRIAENGLIAMPQPNPSDFMQVDARALSYFDNDGVLLANGPDMGGENGLPASISCWNSFTGVPPGP